MSGDNTNLAALLESVREIDDLLYSALYGHERFGSDSRKDIVRARKLVGGCLMELRQHGADRPAEKRAAE